jgi:glycosyltransferase involved in cell wall biosynthesis
VRILYHHRIRSQDGQYVHIEEMVRALRGLSHEVILVGPATVEEKEFGTDTGGVALLKKLLPRAIYELLEYGYALRVYSRLRAAVSKHRPDCIYERYNLFQPAGVWVKERFGVPLVLEVNAPLLEERSKYGGLSLARLARRTDRITWDGADYVITVTRVLADLLQAKGVPAAKLVVTPNGVRREQFERSESQEAAKARLGLAGRMVLGFTGFIRDWHGLDSLVDLIAERRGQLPLHLLVVGDGRARASLEQRARERNVSDALTITGIVGREAIAGYLAAFDIALQPAVVDYASPLKLFEYMAAGCAIVAPAKDNIREILTDGKDGLLFEPGNTQAFAAAVDRLCADAALRQRLSAGARQTLRERDLSWEKNARIVTQLFEGLIRASKEPPPAVGKRESAQKTAEEAASGSR